MTTPNTSNIQAQLPTTAGTLLAALKATMGTGGASSLFAGLLSEVGSSMPEVKPAEPKADLAATPLAPRERTPEHAAARDAVAQATAKQADHVARRAEDRKDSAKKTKDPEKVETQRPDQAPAENVQEKASSEDVQKAVASSEADPEVTEDTTDEAVSEDLTMMELLAALCPLDETATAEKSVALGQSQTMTTTTNETTQTDAPETPTQSQTPLMAMQEAGREAASEKEQSAKAKAAIASALNVKADHRASQTETSSTTVDLEASAVVFAKDSAAQDSASAQGNAFGQSNDKNGRSNHAQQAQTTSQTNGQTAQVTDLTTGIPAQGLVQQSNAPQKAAAGSAVQDIMKIGTASANGSSPAAQPTGEGVRASAGYDFASQLSALRAVKTTATTLPQAIEQVSVQLNKMAKEGLDQITIQLKPVELGKIEIRLEIAADKTVHGTIIADNQSTLNLLSKDAGSLQRALLDAGLQADAGNLSFSLKGENQNQFADGQKNQQGHGTKFAMVEAQTDTVFDNVNDDVALALGRVNLRV